MATGGDPGGFIQITDAALDGVMWWLAPAKFRGDHRDAYGATLSFSSTQSAGDSRASEDP